MLLTGPPPSLPERIRTDEADVLMLPDGRALAYLEWGDSIGYPAFYFHGTPSSRLEGPSPMVPRGAPASD